MSITRKMLEGMGLSAEAVEAIVEANSQSLMAIKTERDALKSENERLQGELTTKVKDYEEKMSDLKKQFDDFKTEVGEEKVRTEKERLYSELLLKSDIPQARIKQILRLTDFDAISIEDGKLKNEDELVGIIEKEWGDYILKGAEPDDKPAHPPAKGPVGKMTKEDIMKIKDPVERQKAIGQNIDVFTN